MVSKLRSIQSHLVPKPVNHEDATFVEDFSKSLEQFFTKKIDYEMFREHGQDRSEYVRNRVLATRLFVRNEVDVLCGFSNDYLSKFMSGHKERVLVGEWKPYREPGLYIRFNENPIGGICLVSQGGHLDQWAFESRLDCSNEKGFFHMDYTGYPSVKKALALSEKLLESLKGYELVSSARNMKTRPNF